MRGIQQQYAPLESQSSCSYLDQHFHVYLTALTDDESQKTLPTHLNLPLLFQIFEKFEKKGKSHKNTSARFYSTFEMNNKESELKRAS
jgi:hypothetical protein